MNRQKIMSVGAHADDIEIGVGRTLAKFQTWRADLFLCLHEYD